MFVAMARGMRTAFDNLHGVCWLTQRGGAATKIVLLVVLALVIENGEFENENEHDKICAGDATTPRRDSLQLSEAVLTRFNHHECPGQFRLAVSFQNEFQLRMGGLHGGQSD